jgi:hypothetical protein
MFAMRATLFALVLSLVDAVDLGDHFTGLFFEQVVACLHRPLWRAEMRFQHSCKLIPNELVKHVYQSYM